METKRNMDGGFRASRAADQRTVNSREPARAEASKPQSAPEPTSHASAPVHHAAKKSGSHRRLKTVIIVIAAIIVLGAAGWFGWTTLAGGSNGIETNKYQAVFFTNGQVYFGKLHPFNGGYMKLTDVYYLQSKDSTSSSDSKNPQSDSTNSSSVQLIKLGSEIHGPEDAMMISKDQILFYENLKPSGKVSQTIAQSKKGDNF